MKSEHFNDGEYRALTNGNYLFHSRLFGLIKAVTPEECYFQAWREYLVKPSWDKTYLPKYALKELAAADTMYPSRFNANSQWGTFHRIMSKTSPLLILALRGQS